MASTEKTTVGVKAIKISKVDADGINQNDQLQEGDLLSLVFSDLGIQKFVINSISEFPDYYLYYVDPKNLGTNNSNFDEPTTVSGTGTGVINAGNYELQGTGGGLVYGKSFSGYNTVNNLTSWTYNSTTGQLLSSLGVGGGRFALVVQYQVEVYTNATSPNSFSFAIEPEGSSWGVTYNNDVVSSNSNDIINGNIITLVAPTNGTGNARSITGSFNIVADIGSIAALRIRPVSYYGAAKFFFPTSSISIDIDTPVSSSTDNDGLNTVIEPYTSENVAINDYNVLINNATSSRINEFYMDVDYSSDAIVAVNSDTILNGSATRATVQYSNYTTARIVNPRYDGSKNTSPDINQGENSSLPTIEQTTGYFLYSRGGNFNTIADRSGSALYNIGFMIDDQGNTYEPQASESSYLPNLLSGFGQGSKVTFVPTDTGSQVAGTYDVHFPARKIKPIIYSDTGSLGNNYLVSGSYSTIEFVPDPSQYDQFNTYVANYNNIIVSSNSSKRYEPDDVLNDQASGWGYNQFGQRQYNVSQSSNVLAEINVALTCSNAASTGTFAAKLYKSGSATPIFTSSVPRSFAGDFNLGGKKIVKLQEGDSYYVEVENTSSANLTIKNFDAFFDQTSFRIAPLTSAISVTTSDSWLTGSSNITSVITASQDLAKAYNYVQANIPGSGFQFPILFNLQQYDEIRYDGNEEKVKLIDRVDYEVDVTANPTEYNLHVYFTEPVDMTTIDKDYYVFRRNEFQKDTIIVDTPGEVIEHGFILPEYQTPELKANLSNIIQDLTDKGLISTT
jgi:hypothetical protein